MSGIYGALLAVISEVDAIGKDRVNQQQNYKFRGIDDMYNALHPLFVKHGIFITSEIMKGEREERTTAKGGLLIYSIIDVKFTFHASDGSSVYSIMRGEAMDSGDKASNKAASTALKYALMQMFLIPTDDKIDTEYESPQPQPKDTPDSMKKEITDRIEDAEVIEAFKSMKLSVQTVHDICVRNKWVIEDIKAELVKMKFDGSEVK